MLVRNLTQSTLNVKSLNGSKKLALPPFKVVEIDELDFPADRLKKLFGRYIHILTEKTVVEEVKDEVPTKPQENLELEKNNGDVQIVDETVTKEKENKTAGSTDSDKDVTVEDANNDSDDVDQLVDSILEEIEGETSTEEEKAPEEQETKTTKKSSKKSAKKQG